MSSATDLSATVTPKLRLALNRGQERLDAIDAMLRRLGVESLNTADLELGGAKILDLAGDEGRHKTLAKAQKWVTDLDEYANGYLEPMARRRVTRHPNNTGGETPAELVENAREAIRSRMETVKHLVGAAAPTPAGADRDAAGGWQHIRDLDLIEDAVLDGYLSIMRARRTIAERRSAIGAAKELVEAVMKGAIKFADPAATGFEKDEMPQLWKQLRKLVQEDAAADPALGGKDIGVAKTVSGMSNVITGIAETRNKVGSGHGNPTVPKNLRESHVLLVIDAAHTMTRFITSRLNELFA
ncbi:abortive infection family protein [Streptomyces olivaceus]